MELIINDLPEHGVVIHGPESPGFRERLLALMARVANPPMSDDDELRYSFIVENQSPQDILKISITLGPYQRESGPLYRQLGGIPINPGLITVSSFRIPLGGQCPWNLLDGYGFPRHKTVSPTGGDRRRENRDYVKKRLAAGDKWSVDIDYVLFDDGVFAGPDTHLEFDHLVASKRASRDMIAELNRKLDAGEDVLAYVEQCASIPWEQINALYPDPGLFVRSPEIVYTWEKKMLAKSMVGQWQCAGKQAMVNWIRERANPKFPLPARFRPGISQMDEESIARDRACKDLIAELNQKLDEGAEIFAHIERYASMTRSQIEALYPNVRTIVPDLERFYAISKKTLAMAIIKRLERFGESATLEWIRESGKSQDPPGRRYGMPATY